MRHEVNQPKHDKGREVRYSLRSAQVGLFLVQNPKLNSGGKVVERFLVLPKPHNNEDQKRYLSDKQYNDGEKHQDCLVLLVAIIQDVPYAQTVQQ